MTPHPDGRTELLEADFTHVMDASPLSLLVLQQGKLVYANARFLRAFSMALDQAIGMDPAFAVVDPGMRERARERARRAEAGEAQPPLVYQTERADGRRIWTRIESTPCVFGGKPASLSIAQEVTDEVEASRGLRESEERYRRLFEDSPLGMAISRDGILLLANPALAELAGAPSTRELSGLSLLHFAEPSVREATLARLRKVQEGGDVPQMSRRLKNLRGREIEVEVISKSFVHEGRPAVLTLAIDTTGRNEAQRKARQSDAKYRHLIESSPNALVVSRDRVILLANPAFARFAGVASPEALIGANFMDFAAPQNRAAAEARLSAVDVGERAAWAEAAVLRADGSLHPVEVQSEPYEHEGAPAILTIMRDTADRMAMERSRREAEQRHLQRYKELIEQLPDGVFVHRGDTIVFANHAAANMFHAQDAEALVGLSVQSFLSPIENDGTLAHVRRLLQGEDVGAAEYRVRRVDGSLFDVRLLAKKILYEGEAAIQSLVRDLSAERVAVALARETEDRYRALVEGLPDGVAVHAKRTMLFANESMARILGVATARELIGRDATDFLEASALDVVALLDEGRPAPFGEYTLRRADGRLVVVEAFGREVTFGDRPALQTVIRDITERKRAERSQAAIYQIADASARATSLFNLLQAVHSAVSELMDARNFFIAMKDSSGENFTFPYHLDECGPAVDSVPISKTLSGHVLAHGKPVLLSGDEMDALIAHGVPVFGPKAMSWIGVPLVVRDASFGMLVVQSYREEVQYTEADRDLLGYVSHHIAEAIDRQRKEDQIEHMAFHDGLTGLPNRLLFEDRLTNAVAQSERRHAPLSVLFVDLDRFKVINDSLGHPIGDEVLKIAGRRLAEALRDGDSLARRGGDEFLILLPDTPPVGAASVAQKLIDNMRAPMHCGGHDLTISASCGIAVFPENGTDSESLLKAADIAMYRAKESGRDAYRLFNPDMNAAAQRRLTVETTLRRSITRREIGPHFQPIVNAATGAVVAAEALLRWSPFVSGTMPPKEFIPVAEQSGLIVALGAFVLREALAHAKDWPMSKGKPMRVSINLAARQVQDPMCVELILDVLREAGFPPERLQLELSESTQITEDAAAVDRLRALKSEGVSIAIDDFGVGYSSLSRLRHLPFDTLKIDGTFIKDISTDDGSGAVAGAVIALGRNLGLEVIAEGVETEAQKVHLLRRGCSLMQGFHFAAAMPSAVFAAWVSQREED